LDAASALTGPAIAAVLAVLSFSIRGAGLL